MSKPNETSPLERAAREAYNPTNRELMDELHRQNGLMLDSNEELRHIRVQTTATNGRVLTLETNVAPVIKVYKNVKVLALTGVTLAPIVFKIMEVALNHIWPTH